jgi:hypothetical protein
MHSPIMPANEGELQMRANRTAGVLLAILALLYSGGVLELIRYLSLGSVPDLPGWGVSHGYDEPRYLELQGTASAAAFWFFLAYGFRIAAEGMWKGRKWAPGFSLALCAMLVLVPGALMRSNSRSQPETVIFLLLGVLTVGTVLYSAAWGAHRPFRALRGHTLGGG